MFWFFLTTTTQEESSLFLALFSLMRLESQHKSSVNSSKISIKYLNFELLFSSPLHRRLFAHPTQRRAHVYEPMMITAGFFLCRLCRFQLPTNRRHSFHSRADENETFLSSSHCRLSRVSRSQCRHTRKIIQFALQIRWLKAPRTDRKLQRSDKHFPLLKLFRLSSFARFFFCLISNFNFNSTLNHTELECSFVQR